MRTLYGLRVSPWTEMARWALDHHAIPFAYHEHVPMLGELLLRRKAGSLRAKASVPLLADGSDVRRSSLEIARYADELGRGTRLFPRGEADAVVRFAELANRTLGAARHGVIDRMMASREAQRESVPAFVPGPLRGVMAVPTKMAMGFVAGKYEPPADPAAVFRESLDAIRVSLGGREHLAAGFSFADIAIACALTALRPPDAAEMGPAVRACWTNEELAREYEDLVMWRDAVRARHR